MGLYSAIIIDCPPSLKLLSSNALSAATHVVIPIESGSQYGLYGVSDLIQHIQKIKRINPSLELLGAILIRHDARLTVSRLIKESAEELLGELIPVSIPISTKANQAVILKQSISALDPKSKIAKAFQALAEFVETRLELSRLNTSEET